MNHSLAKNIKGCRVWLYCFGLTFTMGAADFSEWQHRQELVLPSTGLFKLSLPVETLDAARADLSDLRVSDAGNEVPYFLEHPLPVGQRVQPPKTFHVTLEPRATILLIDTGSRQPLEGITLFTPAVNFIKAVQVEGSQDLKNWTKLAQGQAIFQQPSGARQLHISVPANVWSFLRLRVDDTRSEAVPFTGAQVHVAGQSAPTELVPVQITERTETKGDTRLVLNLGASHLNLAAVRIAAEDLLFTRQVTLAVREMDGGTLREQSIARGIVYRVEVEGQPSTAQLEFPVGLQTSDRELVLLIHNQDNPPLHITAVEARRQPVYVSFMAKQPGTYFIFSGNNRALAPHYDLGWFRENFKNVAVFPLSFTPLARNPEYHPGEALPEVSSTGTTLDVSAWRYRKPVQTSRAGVQELELDLEVLAHAQSGFGDLRLVSDGRQIPFLLQPSTSSRSIRPETALAPESKKPGYTRWSLKLPESTLPLQRLTCTAKTALFQRNVLLYEEVPDERGETFKRPLGEARWAQTPGARSKELILEIHQTTSGNTLFLEINNEDNPPIELENFQFFYPATRLFFKTGSENPIHLYYGNPKAMAPRYDLTLVAPQLLSFDKSTAEPGPEESLKKAAWTEGKALGGSAGILFWAILGVVVIGLLIVISRLLPKEVAEGDTKNNQ